MLRMATKSSSSRTCKQFWHGIKTFEHDVIMLYFEWSGYAI